MPSRKLWRVLGLKLYKFSVEQCELASTDEGLPSTTNEMTENQSLNARADKECPFLPQVEAIVTS